MTEKQRLQRKTDVAVKVLLRKHARDLLGLLGDPGAEVLDVQVIELQELKRTVDGVVKLRRGGLVYYRHLEFQAEADPTMPARVFAYATRLVLQLQAPVVSTVVYLYPPGPKQPPVFRVMLGEQEVNRWQFEAVCLWELDAQQALARGGPGLWILAPLMKGRGPQVVGAAVRRLERALPPPQFSEALDVLLRLALGYYTGEQLKQIVGRDRIMQSSLWQEAVAEGEARGRAEGEAKGRAEGEARGEAKGEAKGRLQAERTFCRDLLQECHPALKDAAAPVIEACTDSGLLKRWHLLIPKATEQEVARALGIQKHMRSSRRGSRPHRRSSTARPRRS